MESLQVTRSRWPYSWLFDRQDWSDLVQGIRRVFEKRFVEGVSHAPAAPYECWVDTGSVRSSVETHPNAQGEWFLVSLAGRPPDDGDPEVTSQRPVVRICLKIRGVDVRGRPTFPNVAVTLPTALVAWYFQYPSAMTLLETNTVSHICHNSRCVNPWHTIIEPLSLNKSRSACYGRPWCRHDPPCALPGRGAVHDDDGAAFTCWGEVVRHPRPRLPNPYRDRALFLQCMQSWYRCMGHPDVVVLPPPPLLDEYPDWSTENTSITSSESQRSGSISTDL